MNKVLIVDDDRRTLKLFKKALKKYEDKFEVLTATNGKEAIKVLKRELISVLATDLVMPKVDGLELLAYMNKNHPQVPCIVMTGHRSPEIKRKAEQEDILDYLEKPIDYNDLASSIIEGLDRVEKGAFQAGVSVTSLLQLIDMEQKTCTLEVSLDKEKKGFFYLYDGLPYDARYFDMRGEDAAFQMIGWDRVGFRFKSFPREKIKQIINRSLMSLIMEGTRLKDEAIAAGEKHDATEVLKTEIVSKQKQDHSLKIQAEEDEMVSQATLLAEGHHFQQAQKVLAKLLKKNPRCAKGWLWYSRVIGNMKAIESSLKNAAVISPEDPEVVEEKKKFSLVKDRVRTERIRHCPFCWSLVEEGAFECHYCKSNLFLHTQFFTSARTAKRKVLEKAIERYKKVVRREKNARAHYYLAMAYLNLAMTYLNLEHWEKAFDQLQKTGELSPENKIFSKQLNSLLNFMTAMETLSKNNVFTRKVRNRSRFRGSGSVEP
jgi:CheY-like chemotaxis protein